MNFTFDKRRLEVAAVPEHFHNASVRLDEVAHEAPRRVVLVGMPNVGKSVVFGALTGTYVTVSNYPGTTVEITRGKLAGDTACEVIDTPGTNNLVPMSEDEAVTRDMLLAERHDALIQVGDAKNLARSILMTLQLAELGTPFILNLNMMDEANARGLSLDLEALREELSGVEINTSTATHGEGLEPLRDYVARIEGRRDQGNGLSLPCAPTYPADVERAVEAISACLPPLVVAKRAVSLMLLCGDRGFDARLAKLAGDEARRVAAEHATDIARAHAVPVFALLSRVRLARAQAIVRACQSRTSTESLASHTRIGSWLARVVGRYATDRLWGIPILLVALFFAYEVVGVFGAGICVDFIENGIFGNVVATASLDKDARRLAPDGEQRLTVERRADRDEVVITAEKLVDGHYVADPTATIDAYDDMTSLVASATNGVLILSDEESQGSVAKIWSGHLNRFFYRFFGEARHPLLTDFFVGSYGLITMGFTYAIAIVLPVVATFFFVFSMLEDSGYLPRLAVMANRQLRIIGLNGKAVLPMVLGLGCDTMATLTARIMETKKERILVTLMLALGIPCSSQLAVILAMTQRTSMLASAVWLFVVLFTILGVGFVAARVVPGDSSDFLLELPPLRRPSLGNLVRKTMARIEWYLREAVPLFIAGTVVLFALDRFNLLRFVHRIGEPVVHHILGFARDGGASDKVSEALLIGFLRRDFGAAGLLDMARGRQLSAADVAVSMVTITLFIPCIANVFMIIKERGWKAAALTCAFVFPYALAMGGLVRLFFNVVTST